MKINKNFKNKIQKIKVLALDVDGVMTDGKLIFDGEGREFKSFDVQDGFGIVMLKRAGIKTAIITAGRSKVVQVRADYLHIDKLYSGAYPKVLFYDKLLKVFKVKDDDVCFMGDDLTDYQIFRRVGLAVAVSNAVQEIKDIAHYITHRSGGQGAVREVIELILKAQEKWQDVIEQDL